MNTKGSRRSGEARSLGKRASPFIRLPSPLCQRAAALSQRRRERRRRFKKNVSKVSLRKRALKESRAAVRGSGREIVFSGSSARRYGDIEELRCYRGAKEKKEKKRVGKMTL